jgi:hypothetical protein
LEQLRLPNIRAIIMNKSESGVKVQTTDDSSSEVADGISVSENKDEGNEMRSSVFGCNDSDNSSNASLSSKPPNPLSALNSEGDVMDKAARRKALMALWLNSDHSMKGERASDNGSRPTERTVAAGESSRRDIPSMTEEQKQKLLELLERNPIDLNKDPISCWL